MSIPELMSDVPIEQVVASAILVTVVVGLTYLVTRLQKRPGRIQVDNPTVRYHPPKKKKWYGTADSG